MVPRWISNCIAQIRAKPFLLVSFEETFYRAYYLYIKSLKCACFFYPFLFDIAVSFQIMSIALRYRYIT